MYVFFWFQGKTVSTVAVWSSVGGCRCICISNVRRDLYWIWAHYENKHLSAIKTATISNQRQKTQRPHIQVKRRTALELKWKSWGTSGTCKSQAFISPGSGWWPDTKVMFTVMHFLLKSISKRATITNVAPSHCALSRLTKSCRLCLVQKDRLTDRWCEEQYICKSSHFHHSKNKRMQPDSPRFATCR